MATIGKIVLFDTNVLIPLCIPASRATRLHARLMSAGWTVAASVAILEEVAEKMRTKENLRRWLRLDDMDIHEFLATLPKLLRVVPGHVTAQGAVPGDPKDDKIIAAAIEAGASYIVSQDRHLLELGVYGSIAMISIDGLDAELDALGLA